MNIKRTIARLNDIISYSEKEFLAVGSTLHDIDRQAVSIILEANRLDSPINISLYDSQKAYFDSVIRDKGSITPSLHRMSVLLSTIRDLLIEDQNHLRKMISQMNGMQKTGLVVRIELAHYDPSADSFAHLAQEVSALSADIKKSAETLLFSSMKRSDHITHSLTNLHDLYDRIYHHFILITDGGLKRLDQMRENHNRSRNLSALLLTGGSELHRRLDIIVSKLQTHDIVRQQLLNVMTLLHEYSSSQSPAPLLKQVIDALKSASGSFNEAVENIRLQLVSISSQLTSLLGNSIQLLERSLPDSDNTGKQKMSHNHMDALVAATCECVKAETLLSALITELTRDMSQNRLSLQEMIALGSDIELSAQNAALTAANIEHSETPLSIMAEQTYRDILSMQDILSRIVSIQERIDLESGQLITLFRNNGQKIETLVEIMAELDERIKPLEAIQFQTNHGIEQLRSQLEHILISISSLTETFHTDTHKSSAIEEAIQLLIATLVEQFPNHQAFEYSTDSKPKYQESPNPAVEHARADDDLGEDIELF